MNLNRKELFAKYIALKLANKLIYYRNYDIGNALVYFFKKQYFLNESEFVAIYAAFSSNNSMNEIKIYDSQFE